jgi:hypothetical protein
MGFMDKIKGLVGKNSAKISQGVDKAGDVVDDKTGNKYTAHIDKGEDAVDRALDKLDDPKP